MTKAQMIQRIQRYLSNGIVNDDFAMSEAEVELYLNDAIAAVVTKNAKGSYAVDGIYTVAEGLLTRFTFSSFTKDTQTGEWYVTLPNAPISLPLGYSVTDMYFVSTTGGRGTPLYMVRAKEATYFRDLPMLDTAYAYIIGKVVYIYNIDLTQTNLTLRIDMVSPGSTSGSGSLDITDDMAQDIFTMVIGLLRQRYNLPQDVNNDGNDIR